MDEVFGYMPPVANPPTKLLLLTLLKQARAFGLGVVLSTQNPVDLDYKGLANAGTWFIGRLQTERDKARVLDGLLGASGGEHLDAKDLEKTLASLGKRQFLLHNVNEEQPGRVRDALGHELPRRAADPRADPRLVAAAGRAAAPAPAAAAPPLRPAASAERAAGAARGDPPVLRAGLASAPWRASGSSTSRG